MISLQTFKLVSKLDLAPTGVVDFIYGVIPIGFIMFRNAIPMVLAGLLGGLFRIYVEEKNKGEEKDCILVRIQLDWEKLEENIEEVQKMNQNLLSEVERRIVNERNLDERIIDLERTLRREKVKKGKYENLHQMLGPLKDDLKEATHKYELKKAENKLLKSWNNGLKEQVTRLIEKLPGGKEEVAIVTQALVDEKNKNRILEADMQTLKNYITELEGKKEEMARSLKNKELEKPVPEGEYERIFGSRRETDGRLKETVQELGEVYANLAEAGNVLDHESKHAFWSEADQTIGLQNLDSPDSNEKLVRGIDGHQNVVEFESKLDSYMESRVGNATKIHQVDQELMWERGDKECEPELRDKSGDKVKWHDKEIHMINRLNAEADHLRKSLMIKKNCNNAMEKELESMEHYNRLMAHNQREKMQNITNNFNRKAAVSNMLFENLEREAARLRKLKRMKDSQLHWMQGQLEEHLMRIANEVVERFTPWEVLTVHGEPDEVHFSREIKQSKENQHRNEVRPGNIVIVQKKNQVEGKEMPEFSAEIDQELKAANKSPLVTLNTMQGKIQFSQVPIAGNDEGQQMDEINLTGLKREISILKDQLIIETKNSEILKEQLHLCQNERTMMMDNNTQELEETVHSYDRRLAICTEGITHLNEVIRRYKAENRSLDKKMTRVQKQVEESIERVEKVAVFKVRSIIDFLQIRFQETITAVNEIAKDKESKESKKISTESQNKKAEEISDNSEQGYMIQHDGRLQEESLESEGIQKENISPLVEGKETLGPKSESVEELPPKKHLKSSQFIGTLNLPPPVGSPLLPYLPTPYEPAIWLVHEIDTNETLRLAQEREARLGMEDEIAEGSPSGKTSRDAYQEGDNEECKSVRGSREMEEQLDDVHALDIESERILDGMGTEVHRGDEENLIRKRGDEECKTELKEKRRDKVVPYSQEGSAEIIITELESKVDQLRAEVITIKKANEAMEKELEYIRKECVRVSKIHQKKMKKAEEFHDGEFERLNNVFRERNLLVHELRGEVRQKELEMLFSRHELEEKNTRNMNELVRRLTLREAFMINKFQDGLNLIKKEFKFKESQDERYIGVQRDDQDVEKDIKGSLNEGAQKKLDEMNTLKAMQREMQSSLVDSAGNDKEQRKKEIIITELVEKIHHLQEEVFALRNNGERLEQELNLARPDKKRMIDNLRKEMMEVRSRKTREIDICAKGILALDELKAKYFSEGEQIARKVDRMKNIAQENMEGVEQEASDKLRSFTEFLQNEFQETIIAIKKTVQGDNNT